MSKNINVTISGIEYSLESIQEDVDAAKAKGYNHDYAFTVHTVQGLIDKINELSNETQVKQNSSKLFTVSGNQSQIDEHPILKEFKFTVLNNNIPNRVFISFVNKEEAESLYNKMTELGIVVFRNWI